jgi:hypothetical protein
VISIGMSEVSITRGDRPSFTDERTKQSPPKHGRVDG